MFRTKYPKSHAFLPPHRTKSKDKKENGGAAVPSAKSNSLLHDAPPPCGYRGIEGESRFILARPGAVEASRQKWSSLSGALRELSLRSLPKSSPLPGHLRIEESELDVDMSDWLDF